jgi:hypothetical protein
MRRSVFGVVADRDGVSRHASRNASLTQGQSAPLERALILRVQGEYDEMPGLCLTLDQAARLFGLDRQLCERLLADCVHAGILRESHGRFVRS